MGKRSPRSGRRADKAYEALEHMILKGGLGPGQRASRRSLSDNLGVGPGAVRDALLRLEAQGLIEQRQKSGITVRQFSTAEVAEVFQVRMFMEPMFAELAAIRGDARHAAQLEKHCDEFDAVVGRATRQRAAVGGLAWRQIVWLDMQFHALVVNAAGDWLLGRFYHHEHLLALHGTWYSGQECVRPVASFTEVTRLHRAIADAIRQRDPDAAAEAARLHIREAGGQVHLSVA